MKIRLLFALLVSVSAAIVIMAWGGRPAAAADDANRALVFSGPYTHKNLSIYLVHGPDRIKIKDFLTLQEALEQKKAVVAETGNVNELTIENLSDMPIYIHAGAILKGGKQDRMIKDDYVVPPRTKITISAFCVESGRWSVRGTEDVSAFSSSSYSAGTKELKLAARSAGEQGQVWKEVSSAQTRLSSNVGGDVRSGESQTSLQLTLEDKKVKEAAEEYSKALADVLKDRKDVVGYAFAINGKINSVDVYGAHALFVKLWPQLLNSTSIEAVAKFEKDKTFTAPQKEEVKTFLEDSRKAEAKAKEVSKDNWLYERAVNDSVNFSTVYKLQATSAPVRENVIKKD